jgi:hypothetical protein
LFKLYFSGDQSDWPYTENCIQYNKKCKREFLLYFFILQNIVHTQIHMYLQTRLRIYIYIYMHVYAPSLPIVSPDIFLYQMKGEVSMQHASFPKCEHSYRSEHLKESCKIYLSFLASLHLIIRRDDRHPLIRQKRYAVSAGE